MMLDIQYRDKAYNQHMPVIEYIMWKIKTESDQGGTKRTLFAACPNSVSVIKAALRAAKRNNAPIKFAATLNQVDTDRGYTGMNQQEFVRMVRLEAEAIHFNGPILIAVDHGGPWLKDVQSNGKWSLEKAMTAVKNSFIASVDAGYDLLHVDPTVDIFLDKDEAIDIETVADRTVELITYVENYRRAKKLPAISYEVGTEEVHGGLADETTFDRFLELLQSGLKDQHLEDVWPCFIVGKVGTDLHTTVFDPQVADNLTQKVRKYNSFIKGHYTDGVENPAAYPASGMGAANVGPEFTISEYVGLMECEQEEIRLHEAGRTAIRSQTKEALWKAVISSNRWKKWLTAEEKELDFHTFPVPRQEWLIQTGCRYIWQDPEVLVARNLLYENLSRNGINGEEIVLSHIERAMDKYFSAFNLIGLNDIL